MISSALVAALAGFLLVVALYFYRKSYKPTLGGYFNLLFAYTALFFAGLAMIISFVNKASREEVLLIDAALLVIGVGLLIILARKALFEGGQAAGEIAHDVNASSR